MARFQETNASDDQNTMGDLRNPGDMDALAEARFPKARKPYMITKQREKWTEEEHKLFLEAMQLHGRAWRRIQEHIGTKTAVQIRSHAQKFFSKVIRESSGDSSGAGAGAGAGAEAPIQIPPPRPKRKSVHPYPCNLRSAPGKHAHALARLEKPGLQMRSVCEQGNGSPTSVVTASQIGSSECSDSDTSTIDVEDRCPTPSVEATEVAAQVPPTDVQLAKRSTSEEVVCDTAEAPRIKLFGQTVAVNDSHQQPNPDSMELDTSAETAPTSGTENISSHGAPTNEWSQWMANAQQFMYYVPQGAVFFSYNGGSVPHPMPSNPEAGASDQQHQDQPSEDENKVMQREASREESNTASTSVPETATRSSAESCTGADGGDDKMAPAAGFRKFVSQASIHQRGFMPYKRCAAESKVLQPQALSEEADGEMTRLCL